MPRLIAVFEYFVDAPLKHGVGHGGLTHGSVARVEYADTLAQTAVEMVRPDIDHFEDFFRAVKFVQKRLVERTADGAGLVSENPFIGLVRKEFPLELVVFEQIVEKLPPVSFWDDEQRVLMAGAGDIDVVLVNAMEIRVFFVYIFLLGR